jgi:hypothetical protein
MTEYDPECTTVPAAMFTKQVPLSRGTAEERSDDAGGSAKPTLSCNTLLARRLARRPSREDLYNGHFEDERSAGIGR